MMYKFKEIRKKVIIELLNLTVLDVRTQLRRSIDVSSGCKLLGNWPDADSVRDT